MSQRDLEFAKRFAAHRAEAEAELWRRMEETGLFARDGWRLSETTREARDGTELVIRPIHMSRDAPSGMECIVHVREDDGQIDMRCQRKE